MGTLLKIAAASVVLGRKEVDWTLRPERLKAFPEKELVADCLPSPARAPPVTERGQSGA